MKHIFLTIIVAGLILMACNDNIRGTDNAPREVRIDATSVAGITPDVVTVKGITYNGTRSVAFATATVTRGGGFTMTLPAVLPDDALATLIPYYTDAEEIPAGVTISDPSAGFIPIYFRGYDADGIEIGYLRNHSADNLSAPEIFYWYLDRNVTIRGSDEADPQYIYNYNLDLRRGWNKILYIATDNAETYTSPVPERTVVGWFFSPVSVSGI